VTAALARSTWARVLVTLAILGYLASRIDMGEAARATVSVEPWHLLAVLALVAVDRGVMIWRWVLLLRAADTPVSAKSAAWIFLVSSFVGSFLPAGVGGDAARAYVLSRRTDRGSAAVASVAVDRLLGIVALGLLGALGALLWVQQADQGLRPIAVSVGLLAAAGSLAVLWVDRLVRGLLPAGWGERRAGARLLRLVDAVAFYRAVPAVLSSVLALSVAVQLLRILQAFLLGRGLGLDVAFAYYLVFMPIGLLMLLLPISVSGFGVPQGVIVWLLRPRGVPDPLSFALSTLIILTGLAGNLPGAVLYLRRKTQ
jgi:glycosyltransferase 2 family protein